MEEYRRKENALKRKKIIHAYAQILFLTAFLLSGCDAGNLTALFKSKIPEEKLDKICKARGGLSTPGPLYVDGYYQPSAGPLFGFEEVQTRLGKARFQFFEMDSAWVHRSNRWGQFKLTKIKGQGRYTRFYLAERGDPNCEAYEEYLEGPRDIAKTKTILRASGIYPDHCIAAINTDELLSEYGISHRNVPDSDILEVKWDIAEIKDMKSGESYAGFSEFRHCYKGRLAKGGCRGDQYYDCPVKTAKPDDDAKVIYYQTFKSTPNPILEKQLSTEEIREPVTVPVHTVTPELIEIVEGKENIKKLWFDKVLDLYMSMDAEGYAWFESRNERWNEDGTKYNSNQPQICFIRDKDRKLLKIDIGIYNPRTVQVYDFCCIRAVPNDGVYFIAWGGRSQLYEKANHFKILKYSWDGKLERITAGVLPFEFFAKHKKGKPVHFYGNLKIEKSHFYFSVFESKVLEMDGNNVLDADGTQFVKEYKFQVSR